MISLSYFSMFNKLKRSMVFSTAFVLTAAFVNSYADTGTLIDPYWILTSSDAQFPVCISVLEQLYDCDDIIDFPAKKGRNPALRLMHLKEPVFAAVLSERPRISNEFISGLLSDAREHPDGSINQISIIGETEGSEDSIGKALYFRTEDGSLFIAIDADNKRLALRERKQAWIDSIIIRDALKPSSTTPAGKEAPAPQDPPTLGNSTPSNGNMPDLVSGDTPVPTPPNREPDLSTPLPSAPPAGDGAPAPQDPPTSGDSTPNPQDTGGSNPDVPSSPTPDTDEKPLPQNPEDNGSTSTNTGADSTTSPDTTAEPAVPLTLEDKFSKFENDWLAKEPIEMKYEREIDTNGDGFINLDILYSEKGGVEPSKQVLLRIVTKADGNLQFDDRLKSMLLLEDSKSYALLKQLEGYATKNGKLNVHATLTGLNTKITTNMSLGIKAIPNSREQTIRLHSKNVTDLSSAIQRIIFLQETEADKAAKKAEEEAKKKKPVKKPAPKKLPPKKEHGE